MLFLKSDSKWGVYHMSRVLALALLLFLSLHILTWNGRPLVQLPCPLGHTSPGSKGDDPAPLLLTKAMSPPNSYFPEADADIWHCKQHHVDERTISYTDWLTGNFTDAQALCAAHRQAKHPIPAGTPRIAFLFLTRGPIPMEPLWRNFFSGHEAHFSLYVHATDPTFTFPTDSLFHNRTIPSKPIEKFDMSLPEALRRLLAYALLDIAAPNAWFHVACDASVPIHGFPHAYHHITNSRHSFVEAFYPTSSWWRSNWSNASSHPRIPDHLMRKGEFWVTLHRRHAGVVVGDHYVFPKFKYQWYRYGLPSEIYIPTLLSMVDPFGIANHSLVYVNWCNHTEGRSSPLEFNHTTVTQQGIQVMQNLTANMHGFYQIDKKWDDVTEQSCVYNGVPNSPCFLFARKFVGGELVVANLMRLSSVLGYGD